MLRRCGFAKEVTLSDPSSRAGMERKLGKRRGTGADLGLANLGPEDLVSSPKLRKSGNFFFRFDVLIDGLFVGLFDCLFVSLYPVLLLRTLYGCSPGCGVRSHGDAIVEKLDRWGVGSPGGSGIARRHAHG
jgi:hypothetical protein